MKAPATRPVMNGYSTMRMLHWSSTSLGYMNPCTPGMTCLLGETARPSLPNGPVETVVIDLGAGRHLRLQDLDWMRAQELVHRIGRVLEIRDLPRARRARLATGRLQPLRDAVIAERALVGGIGARIDVAAPV